MMDLGTHAITMIDWWLCALMVIEIFFVAIKDNDSSMLLAIVIAIISTWIAFGTIGLCGLFIINTVLFVLFIYGNLKNSKKSD